MKKILSLVLVLAVFSTLAMAGAPANAFSDEMAGPESGALVGGSWESFFVGAGCAIGIAGGIAIVASGVGAAATAAVATAGAFGAVVGASGSIAATLAACAATLGI